MKKEEWNDAVEIVKAVEALQIVRTKEPEDGGQPMRSRGRSGVRQS